MSAPGRIRLFAALELPPEAIAGLEDFRDRAADPELWRPLPAESLHVTLAFLGATDPALVEPLGAALTAAAGPAPRLRPAGALLLPPRRARVLCAALDDLDRELAQVQARVSEGLAATGAYAPEARPFRPHVTVARLRRGLAAPRVVEERPEPVEFHGSALTLFASHPSPAGSRYQALARIPLPH
jgi:2'-5' RNA ligase